jgi:hypothetical protein
MQDNSHDRRCGRDRRRINPPPTPAPRAVLTPFLGYLASPPVTRVRGRAAAAPGFFAKDRVTFTPDAHRAGPLVLQVDLVVATPDQWESRPESRDPRWSVARRDWNLVVAFRAES